jgi:L-2-hydroxyglutarate oxidase LhgO
MHLNQHTFVVDYLIIGSGIMGLSIARELLQREPQAKIAIVEKESSIGLHASGRNSGVLHSGIYYPQDSLKARVCLDGSRLLQAYCDEFALPINRIGKVIVPTNESDGTSLNTLYQRALSNKAQIHLINETELKKIEPETRTATGFALFAPEACVIDSQAVMQHLFSDLQKKVHFYLSSPCVEIDTNLKKIKTPQGSISYGHLFNTAGLFADKIAHKCAIAARYTMIPFKGIYHALKKDSPIKINHLVYPVPDMNVPFLGVHFTKSSSGTVYVGPSAIPALGRENYIGIDGLKINELINTVKCLGKQYCSNKQGFRAYAHQEIPRVFKSKFLNAAQGLIPQIKKNDLITNSKVGIRAQLYDKQSNELVMDFLIEKTQNETHVLNAVSPAFTSAFSFAKLIIRT